MQATLINLVDHTLKKQREKDMKIGERFVLKKSSTGLEGERRKRGG